MHTARVALTALDASRTQHALTYTNGPGSARKPQIWAAASIDGVWLFERVEGGGTPWHLTHVPTGEFLVAGSLPRARRLTADPAAVDRYLRGRAARDLSEARRRRVRVTPGAAPGTQLSLHDAIAYQAAARALRTVAILDGTLLPARSGDPGATCRCSGLLAHGGQSWIHVNGCPRCWAPGSGWSTCACPELHIWCPTPDPMATAPADDLSGLAATAKPACREKSRGGETAMSKDRDDAVARDPSTRLNDTVDARKVLDSYQRHEAQTGRSGSDSKR